VIDGLVNGLPAALEGVKSCEEKLNQLQRDLDGCLITELTNASAAEGRELLLTIRLMLDLERIGGLITSFAERTAIVRQRLEMEDVEHLTRMGCLLENMLWEIGQAFLDRNLDRAIRVLRADSEIDRLRNLLLVLHTENPEGLKRQESFHVLSMANALERAGDHVKHTAEQLCQLVSGQSVRHLRRAKDKPIEQLFIACLSRAHFSR
jgi:phosphate transport system protein